MEERKIYSLIELNILLEEIRQDKSESVNLPSALYCLLNEINELRERMFRLESATSELFRDLIQRKHS